MSIQITGRHLDIQPELKTYAEERIGRLYRYYDRIQKVQVVLSPSGPRFSAEMMVTAPKGTQLVAEATEEGLNAAVDKVLDKIERQITKHKEKMRDHRRESGRLAARPDADTVDDEDDDLDALE